MKKKTKETIWEVVAVLSVFLIIGLTGSCEQGDITPTQYIVSALGVSVISFIAVIKLRIMEASEDE